MQQVMQKATELAKAILQSDVYRRMKQAKDAIDADASIQQESVQVKDLYKQFKSSVLEQTSDKTDSAVIREAYQQAFQRLHSSALMIEMDESRKAFDDMMTSVNQVLQLVINGRVEETSDSSTCAGKCNCCSACCRK